MRERGEKVREQRGGSDGVRRWMLARKEERRTEHVVRRMLERQKGRRESESGKPDPGAFL